MKPWPEYLASRAPGLLLLLVAAFCSSGSAQSPQLLAVTDAAAGLPDMAPGMLIWLVGSNLPPSPNGVLVRVEDGAHVTQANVLLAGPERIQAVLPFDLEGVEISIQVNDGALYTNSLRAPLKPFVPRIFTADSSGAGDAWAFHDDGSPVTTSSPLRQRERTRVLLTGLGALQDSSRTPTGGDRAVCEAVQIDLGGLAVRVSDLGVTDLPGIYYVDFVVPEQPLPASVPFTITILGAASQPGVTLPARRSEFYVSPSGGAAASGSIDDPWDLATALQPHPAIQPGDTIWLRGGAYGDGATLLTSRLHGEPTRPVILRQYPGERATISGGLAIYGAHAWYWGFEVTGSGADRSQALQAVNTYDGSIGVKLINLVLHDTAQGVGFWEAAPGAEIHGCVIYNNGYQGSDRGHGHGIYAQNRQSTKTISDNIIFNQFGAGIHVYGTENAAGSGFRIRGNVVFNNGSLAQGVSNVDNILLAVGTAMSDMVVANNYTWHTPELNQGTSRLGWVYGVPNRDLIATGNYWIGGFSPFECWRWDRITYSGNVSYAPKQFPVLLTLDSSPAPASFDWDGNTYYGAQVFRFNGANLDFAQWRAATSFDRSSRYQSGAPQGLWRFVRPNLYEPGRGHIIVYNWDLAAETAIDLRPVVKPGAAFEIRDAQNYFGPPLVTGTFDGTPVTIPLRAGPVAQALGEIPSPPKHTDARFNVFVVSSR